MISESILRQEISAYKEANQRLATSLRETIKLKEAFQELAVKNSEKPNVRLRDLEKFFTNVEEFLHLNVTYCNGKAFIDSVHLKKLMELFPPDIQ